MRSQLSIAMATYNGAQYLRAQIDSIMEQTLDFDEFVIVDDASTDDTWDIILEYSKIDSRIKSYKNSVNIGFKRNFEKSINLCNGKYIALSDQDDIWLPNHLKVLFSHIANNMLVCGDADLINSLGEKLNKRLSSVNNYYKKNVNNKSIFNFIMYNQNPFQGASMMIRQDFINKILPIPQSVKYHDVWFAINACLNDSFMYINTPITLYRMHGLNASGDHKHSSSIIKTFLGHLIKRKLDNNRKEILLEFESIQNYDGSSLEMINEAETYYKDRSVLTRLNNLLFEIKNFKYIYGRE